jgi:hypothetical protein
MLAMVLSFLMALTPLGQQNTAGIPLKGELKWENRAAAKLLLGKGHTSGMPFYDVVITRQPGEGILIKLDYTRLPTKFSFDLHHRLSLDPGFVYPAEIITNIEVLSGGTTSIGTYTISGTIKAGDVFEETVDKVSKADVDRYVTPFGKRTISMNLIPGSQSISIVGQSVIVTRGTRTTRIETPGQRIAVVSNFKYEENRPGTSLDKD